MSIRALSGGVMAGWSEFGDLYRGEAPRLAVFAMTLGADPDRAADLAQESLVALWRRWYDVPGTPRTFARILAVRAARRPPTDTAPVPASDVPVSDVPVSDVPVSDVPVSDVPVSDVPVSDVPVSDVPVSDDAQPDAPQSEVSDPGTPEADGPGSRTPTPDGSGPEGSGSEGSGSDGSGSDGPRAGGPRAGGPLRFPTAAQYDAVLIGLAQLPAHEQQVLVTTFDDLPPEDVAQVLQIRVDAVEPTADAACAALESRLDGRSPRPAYEALVADIAAGMDLEAGLELVAASRPVPAPRAATTPRSGPHIPEELVKAAMTGDRAAVARLLEVLRPLVARYCRGKLGPVDRSFASADDVAQEVCLAVLGALGNYRLQGRPFLAFVYGIASHKVIDAHRAVSRGRTDPVADVPDRVAVDAGPEQQALRGALSAQLRALLDELPEKQREILVLRIVVGLSAEETAQIVGASPGAVRVAQHRALTRLRRTAPRTLVQDQP